MVSALVGLKVMIKAMAPEGSWRWLAEICNALNQTEPHRVCRRLQLLRDWSYDKADLSEIFIGSARACRTDGA